MFSFRSLACMAILGAALFGIAACGGSNEGPKGQYDSRTGTVIDLDNPKRQTVFGEGGLLGGRSSGGQEGEGGGGIGVNSFLWRASLDTIAFMPLASADPFGGVIITDWYTPAATPDERFKVTVYILDRRLRSDGIKVAVFKQTRNGTAADWADTAVAPDTAISLENAILSRARELRVASIQ
ncbi:DUF3576 domain-containing protein [Desertibaculum subflavum]|uniref:DUF3576 domain-containing protein n=1 Tax=Desertibaculum subflavum TaxID=2268458 RepID=UPI0034D33989